jgi:protein-arginine kinase activator protein McsA
MQKFTDITNIKLLRNKINIKTKLYLIIKCDFCDKEERYYCENKVIDKEENWLSSEIFLQSGWNEINTIEKRGIGCPECVVKWKNGEWYKK